MNLKNKNFWLRVILLCVFGYEGLGGITGSLLLIIAPDGQLMKMPVEIMHGTFKDFLIPGIILLVLGIITLRAFFKVLRKKSTAWFWTGVALGGFYIWFITEIIILRELHWLHMMWGLPVLIGIIAAIPIYTDCNYTSTRNFLIRCGMLSSIWYVAINIFVPLQDNNYIVANLTVSELSAIGAPTRILWVLLCSLYTLLFAAFGWGVLHVDTKTKTTKAIGWIIIFYSVFNLYWPPMHVRGITPTLTDTMHIVWASVTVFLMIAMMIIGSNMFGKVFRIYTILSLVTLICFGILTGRESPNIPINEPTPMIGVWERINIGVFMLWIVIFSDSLFRKDIAGSKLKMKENIISRRGISRKDAKTQRH
jgi:hypothetical protein